MRGQGRVQAAVRAFIGRHRKTAPVRGLHALASFVESAYENEGAEFDRNGERGVLERLADTTPHLVFDVGANHGDWLLEALRLWPHCDAHAFEVAPETFRVLSARVSATTDANRVHLNECGLSEASGTEQMYFFPGHPELTCDRERHEGKSSVPFTARIERGDEYLERHGIDRVDFLKIDVEGAEHRVLRGFSQALDDGRVQCLQFEYGAFSTQTRVLLADYYTLLDRHFWIGKIYPAGVEFRDYHWSQEDFRFANYCAVLRTRPDLKARLQA